MKKGKKQHIGSHTNHARPDSKMGRSVTQTSTQKQVTQKVANGKRRHRDK